MVSQCFKQNGSIPLPVAFAITASHNHPSHRALTCFQTTIFCRYSTVCLNVCKVSQGHSRENDAGQVSLPDGDNTSVK
jgi:hypothetical protein